MERNEKKKVKENQKATKGTANILSMFASSRLIINKNVLH